MCWSAAAAEPLALRYAATWAGLPAGQIDLHMNERESVFSSRVEIQTEGLPRILSHFQAAATSQGRLSETGFATPDEFQANYRLRQRHKRIAIRFEPADGGIVAKRDPGDSNTKPPLPETYRRNAVDPLSVLQRLRWHLAQPEVRRGQPFTIQGYDGKRRFDLDGRVVGAGSTDWGGHQVRTLQVKLLLKPIAGFKHDPGDDEDPEDRPREIDLLVTDDENLVPLRLSVPIFYLSAVVTLVGDPPRG